MTRKKETPSLPLQESNRKLLNESFEAYYNGTITSKANLQRFFTKDVVFKVDLPDRSIFSYSIGGVYKGRCEVQEYLNFLVKATKVKVTYFQYTSIMVEGDMIVAIGREKFRVIATKKVYNGAFSMVFHFRRGKVARCHIFGDNDIAKAFIKS